MANEKQVNKAVSSLEGVVFTCPGDHIAPVYKRVYNAAADRNLVDKVDEIDLYEFIQASKSSTDLAVLEKRFIELGEIPNVDPTLGSNDLTMFPQNIHEVYGLANDVEGAFNKLPDSIKQVFGTKEAYMKALLDGSFSAAVLAAAQKTEEKKVEENTNE